VTFAEDDLWKTGAHTRALRIALILLKSVKNVTR
jgi:hypothetical protein